MTWVRWLGSLAIGISLVGFVAADGVSLVVELEGDLSESGDRFTLSVNGQRWTLDLNEPTLPRAREIVTRSPGAKVFVFGMVRARVSENGLVQLANRLVQVTALEAGIPGIKITKVWDDYPASRKLKEKDIIREVEGKRITNFQRLLEVLEENRGKQITVVVIRNGRYLAVPAIELRSSEARLGIAGDVVWTRPDAAPATPLTPDKFEKTPPKVPPDQSEKTPKKSPY
jgi:hypothetical protein